MGVAVLAIQRDKIGVISERASSPSLKSKQNIQKTLKIDPKKNTLHKTKLCIES